MIEYFRVAFKNIKARRMRSWLTVIGIFIGIAAVVSLISLSRGMQGAINEQFEKMGANKIVIMPGSGLQGALMGASGLTDHDTDVIKKARGVDLVGGLSVKLAKVKFRKEVKYTWLDGLPVDESKKIIDDMQAFSINEGRDLGARDTYKAVVGYRVRHQDLFAKDVRVRDTIEIEGKNFEVIGVMDKIGNKDDDSAILIPLDTLREILGEKDELAMIVARVKDGYTIQNVAEEIKDAMRKDRDQEKGEENFAVQTTEDVQETSLAVLGIIEAILIGIAAISLVVGGIGIMNTMYTSVLDRVREIGVMKAIGATNNDIMLIFLVESGMLGLAGGIIGILLGLIGSITVSQLATVVYGFELLQAHFSVWLIGGSLLFSFFIGVISGLVPAYRASRQNPVDALRYE